MSTFVSVGNATQPFGRLLADITHIASILPHPVIVQHGHTPFGGSGACIAVPFVNMEEFARMVNEAGLLIMHAGAGSVIHAIRAGKIPVVMPRRAKYGEHVDDHQLAFSHMLKSTGKVVLAEEPVDLKGGVEEAIRRQNTQRVSAASSPMIGLVGTVLDDLAKRIDR